MSELKKVIQVLELGEQDRDTVGDGFEIYNVFGYGDWGRELNPFVHLDYAPQKHFAPAPVPRGVGEHPHRGFETVTILYSGGVDHRDSAGHGGSIGPGDVQWMTAAKGVVHEEKHSKELTQKGGDLELFQLWVNLPAAQKMSEPSYQEITTRQIPVVEQDDYRVRVIAGDYQKARGVARTATRLWVLDVEAQGGKAVEDAAPLMINAPEGWVAAFISRVKPGSGDHPTCQIFSRAGEGCTIKGSGLFLCAEPLEEPMVAYGPFVMNTRQEIQEAILDYQAGKMGRLK